MSILNPGKFIPLNGSSSARIYEYDPNRTVLLDLFKEQGTSIRNLAGETLHLYFNEVLLQTYFCWEYRDNVYQSHFFKFVSSAYSLQPYNILYRVPKSTDKLPQQNMILLEKFPLAYMDTKRFWEAKILKESKNHA